MIVKSVLTFKSGELAAISGRLQPLVVEALFEHRLKLIDNNLANVALASRLDPTNRYPYSY